MASSSWLRNATIDRFITIRPPDRHPGQGFQEAQVKRPLLTIMPRLSVWYAHQCHSAAAKGRVFLDHSSGSHLFFRHWFRPVVARRYERASIILTLNLIFGS
jgi:IstB-like ATP binding protein